MSPHMDSIGGVGWGGLITSMYACGTTSCYVDVTFLHACTSTPCYVDVTSLQSLHACTSTQCYEIRESGLLKQLKKVELLFTQMDGCQSWKTVAREHRKQQLVVKSVVHMRSEWTRKVRVRRKTKVAGTQQIDRCWNHLQFFCPSQMKNRTGPTINARFWDRIYQWIYRHNCLNET